MEALKNLVDAMNHRIERELERFKVQLVKDFKCITLDYVKRQIEYSSKVQEAWMSLLPELEAVNSSCNVNGLVTPSAPSPPRQHETVSSPPPSLPSRLS